MTSLPMPARRTRAGMLVLALALVGGTGCITTAVVQEVQQKNRLRALEQARQQNIARLAPRADAGDPAAATALVHELLAFSEPQPVDQARVVGLLSGAARANHGPAQALLGEMLVDGRLDTIYPRPVLAPRFQDPEGGLEWLRQAASRGCSYRLATGSSYRQYRLLEPARRLEGALARSGRRDEARLWQARSVMHCGAPDAQALYWRTTPRNATPQQRAEALALLLLAADPALLAKAEAAMPADEVAAARREAEQLRHRVAQSEQQYPAPASRKEVQ